MTFNDIKAAILDWTVDESLESRVPTFIKLVEAKLNKRMRIQEMVCRAVLVNPADEEIRYKLPADYLGTRTIIADGNPVEYVTPERMFQGTTLSGTYRYTIVDQHYVFKAPTTADSEIEIYYYQRIPALTETGTINWVSESCPDVYIYGALAEAYYFQFDEPRAQMWEGKFETEIELFKDQSDNARWSGSAMAVRAM